MVEAFLVIDYCFVTPLSDIAKHSRDSSVKVCSIASWAAQQTGKFL